MADIQAFLSRLSKVKNRGQDKWVACCPAHNDKNPSLYVTHAKSGKILYHCMSGCGQDEVIRSMGMSFADVGDGSQSVKPYKPKEPTVDDYVIEIGKSMMRRGERINRQDINRYKQAVLAIARRKGTAA